MGDEVEQQQEMLLLMQGLVLGEGMSHEQEEEEEEEEEDSSFQVKVIEEITGYKFHDPTLLRLAFTHPTYEVSSSSLGRLAYVGDAFLNFSIAKEHYSSYPDLEPGMLTRLRAANVDTEKLARVALKYRLQEFLRHTIPLLDAQVHEFTNAISEYPLHSSGLIDAPKVLADIVESLIGAIFIDSKSSIDTTWKIVKTLLEPIITPATLPTHPVTRLLEMCQKKRFKLTMMDSWRETGEIEFFVDGEFAGKAKYPTKRSIAKTRAAQNAYYQILEKLDELDDTDVI